MRLSWRSLRITLALCVVALVVVGQIIFLVGSIKDSGPALITGNTASLHGTLAQKLRTILAASLGPGHRGIARFTLTRIAPDAGHSHLKVVDVRWAIDNNLSAGSVGNGAEVDVFAMLQAIFTAHLPIAQVRLDGTYPERSRNGKTVETSVMRVSMDRKTANLISQNGWENMDPETLWPLVKKHFVAADFRPIPTE